MLYGLNSLAMLLIMVLFLRIQCHASPSSAIKNISTPSMVELSNGTLQHLIAEAADAKYIRAVFNTSFPTLPHKDSPLIPWLKKSKSLSLISKSQKTHTALISTMHCTYQQEAYFNQDMININQTWFVCEKANNTFHWQVISQKSF